MKSMREIAHKIDFTSPRTKMDVGGSVTSRLSNLPLHMEDRKQTPAQIGFYFENVFKVMGETA